MNKINPSKKQLEFMDWEFGVFFHFGIRTFYEGHKDWDMKPMSLNTFNPIGLDCNQWLETAKKAGAKYAILVCKHHDGFANWPTRYSEYSVKNTPWRDGKGDVVREYVEACRRNDIKVGLYYSPADFESKTRTAKEHDDFFINQISELLEGYGKIDYLWFDGNGSEGHEYDSERIVKEIRRLQPEIIIFNMWDPDTRWCGNESGFITVPNNNIVDSVAFSVSTSCEDILKEKIFLPAECDCMMRFKNWFYSEGDESTVKSLDELMGIYYCSVGRGANLLINIGPNRDGLLPEKDANRLVEFGNRIKNIFLNKIADINSFVKDNNTYTIEFENPVLINHVVVEENLENSQHVERFKIYARVVLWNEEILLYDGYTIGHKAICPMPTINTKFVKLVIEKDDGWHLLNNISLFYIQ